MARYCEHCRRMDDKPLHITYAAVGTYPADPEAVAQVLAAKATDQDKADALAAIYDTTDHRHHVAHCGDLGCDAPQEG